jgi:sulfur-carrier protein adenylyltransferase/sulfurtransferase
MSKPLRILAVIVILAGISIAFLPERNNVVQLDAEEIMFEMKTESNMESVDNLAKMLIEKDPALLIIDVRTAEEFAEFSLPGSMNIPLDQILNPDWKDLLEDFAGVYHKVFVSNGTSRAAEAWMICRRQGFKNNYILKGGINEWFSLIIHPDKPKSTEDTKAMADYERRLGFKQFFTGGKASAGSTDNSAAPTINIKKKKGPSGGCG